MSSRVAILLSALLLASGCQVTTDLGKECTLKKTELVVDSDGNPVYRMDGNGQVIKDKNGNPIQETKVVDILESELTSGQDYIAFGVTECEDLICIRDVDAKPNPAYDPNSEDPSKKNAPARGYCSRACIQGADASACEVTEPNPVEGVKERMDCRSLLLDQASLDALRASDPEAYRATFGDTNSPYFCAGKPASSTGT